MNEKEKDTITNIFSILNNKVDSFYDHIVKLSQKIKPLLNRSFVLTKNDSKCPYVDNTSPFKQSLIDLNIKLSLLRNDIRSLNQSIDLPDSHVGNEPLIDRSKYFDNADVLDIFHEIIENIDIIDANMHIIQLKLKPFLLINIPASSNWVTESTLTTSGTFLSNTKNDNYIISLEHSQIKKSGVHRLLSDLTNVLVDNLKIIDDIIQRYDD